MWRRDVERSSVLPARAGLFRPGLVLVLAGLCVPAAGLPALPGLAAQEVREGAGVYYIPGHVSGDRFGEALAVLGDVDGDGVQDFAASGVKSPEGTGPILAGHVALHSGRTGALLRRWLGDRARAELGRALAALPDLDADGVHELGVVNAGGELFAYSPHSGERLYEVPGWEHSNDLGSATLIRTADLDGDEIEEVFYVDTFASTDYPDDPDVRGRVVQFSGRDGGILWERKAEADLGELYRYAALAGDHDRDGVEDLLVTRKPEVTGVSGEALHLFSGRDGSLLETFHVADERNSWGLGLVNLGDRDGDGFPEILVAAPAYHASFVGGVAPYGDESGWVGLYRLPDFRLEWSFLGRHAKVRRDDSGDQLGHVVEAAGDVDGDGVGDVLVGTSRTTGRYDIRRYGRLYLHSGLTGEVLMVWEANLDLFEENADFNRHRAFFEVLAPIGGATGDGAPDFLVGRPSNSDAFTGAVGIVRLFRYRDGPRFRRADLNGDGRADVADAASLLRVLFARLEEPPCPLALDVDGSGGARGGGCPPPPRLLLPSPRRGAGPAVPRVRALGCHPRAPPPPLRPGGELRGIGPRGPATPGDRSGRRSRSSRCSWAPRALRARSRRPLLAGEGRWRPPR
jgi:hypothetical protein